MPKALQIFLAEDNYADELFLKQLLNKIKIDYSIKSAPDGESALELLLQMAEAQSPPDVIMLDVKLPKLNGLEVLKSIKQNRSLKDIPVIVMTGSDDPDDLDRTKELGAKYIKKPPDIARLCDSLNIPVVADLSDTSDKTDSFLAAKTQSPRENSDMGTLTLLLVEDNQHDARLVKSLIDSQSSEIEYDITVAEDLASAIKFIRKIDFDIIALDLQLPDTSGMETFTKLYQVVPDIPIVVVTGSDDQGLGKLTVARGAQDCVVKGCQNYAEVLTRSLQYAIHRKRSERLSRRVDKMEATEHFIAVLAHELKTPIIGANTVLEALVDQRLGDLTEAQIGIIQRVIVGQKNTLAMITDILEVYKFEKDIETISFHPTDISAIVEDSKKQLSAKAQTRNINIVTHANGRVPNIMADSKSIRRVVYNLIDNAVKYGSADSSVDVILKNEEDSISLYIKDKGPGIGQHQRERIFKRFWQGAVEHHYEPGTGQGLYYCKQVVDAHSGVISYESESGSGTTFKVLLPITQVARAGHWRD